ncbi:uncharacterized protein LOC108165700 [Poecilia reticulata]|uniref:uncharacterized protein LOC108165700 n=1 Tax=Poecilia reticulata TaxID=8081 RepID=UPI0007EAEF85|nr:PREDICTED: uncharacterized protein LOC108165700 [Poecilia reticulata]
MVNHNPPRIILMLVGLFALFPAITLNFLSGFGDQSGVFRQRTEDVALKYKTSVTPAQWTFFVWDFVHFWFFAMFVYFLAGLCRRSTYEWMYATPAVLPYGFHVSVITYLSLNITWLFLYDREMLLPVLITSALMTLTDYMMLFFSCHGLKIYGAWLSKHRNADLWMFRILVQNGVAVYATWGTLSTLLNLTIYLQHQTEASRYHCTMLSLLLLLMELLVWFLLENFYLDEHMRYTAAIYPVVILWLTGILDNNASPVTNLYILEVLILVIACVLLVVRIILVGWRHHKQPLYMDNELSLTPVEISLSQPNLFL